MLKRRSLQPLLGQTIGYLTPDAEGYVWRQLVRFLDLDRLSAAQRAWRELTGPEVSVAIIPIDSHADTLQVAAELRCQAEQTLPLLVASGSVEPAKALVWLEEELRCNRVVFGPGFRQVSFSEDQGEDAEFSSKEDEPFLGENSASVPEDLFQSDGEPLGPEDSDPVTGGEDMSDESNAGTPPPNPDEEPWLPCRVCGDSACGQRLALDLPVLPFSKVEKLLQEGILVPTDQEDVLVAVHPEALPWRRRRRGTD
jgi:hypothetical protein